MLHLGLEPENVTAFFLISGIAQQALHWNFPIKFCIVQFRLLTASITHEPEDGSFAFLHSPQVPLNYIL